MEGGEPPTEHVSPSREPADGAASGEEDVPEIPHSIAASESPAASAQGDPDESGPARESGDDDSAAEGKQPPQKKRRRGDPVVREAMRSHGSDGEGGSEREGGPPGAGRLYEDGFSSDEETPEARKARETAAAELAASVRSFLVALAKSPGTRPAAGTPLDKMRRAVAYFRSNTMILRTSRRGRRPVEDDWAAAEPVAKTKEKVKVEESLRNYAWPRLGPRYQATIPDCAVPLDSPTALVPPADSLERAPEAADAERNDLTKRRLCWHPGNLEPAAVDAYLRRAEDMFESGMPYEPGMNRYTSVREHALQTLHRAKYDPAVARTQLIARPFELPEDAWQPYEREQFDRTLFVNAARDFSTAARALQNVGSRKTYGEIIQHYYRWKTSEGYKRWQRHMTRGKSSTERTTATSAAAAAAAASGASSGAPSMAHCGICGGGIRRDGTTATVPCDDCGRALHASCGAQATSGGRGGRHLCNKCLKAQNKRKEAAGVPPSPAPTASPAPPTPARPPPAALTEEQEMLSAQLKAVGALFAEGKLSAAEKAAAKRKILDKDTDLCAVFASIVRKALSADEAAPRIRAAVGPVASAPAAVPPEAVAEAEAEAKPPSSEPASSREALAEAAASL